MTTTASDRKRIRGISARATPLWERQHAEGPTPNPVSGKVRLERWREILGSPMVWNRRVRSSTVPRRALEGLVRGAQSDATLPSWASTLTRILRLSSIPESEAPGQTTDRTFDGNRLLPFQEVMVDFIRYARARLKTEAGIALEVLQPSALVDLERQLLAHLTFVASLTLGRDFYEFRFAQAPASAIETVWRQLGTSTRIYSAYVRHMRNGGMAELLEEYPVLARLLSQSIEQWVRGSVHFCQSFAVDFADLRALLGWNVEHSHGALAHLRTDLSDRHNGGQSVTECILRTDERVIYKPRTVGPEVAFNRFIAWLNDCGLSLKLKVIRALDRTTHGWVESVARASCDSKAEVERFYVRAGMLLGVLHLLAATDMHCENLIASGEHPVVVDLETLLNENGQRMQRPLNQDPDRPTVLTTGFLPRWLTAPDGHRYDMSALAADDQQDSGIRIFAWRSINTDQMTFSEDGKAKTTMAHRVSLAGTLPSVVDHLQSFLDGFREAYTCLLRNRDNLLSNEPLLREFDELELRIVMRSTSTYTGLHLYLLHPEFLKDGIDRSIEIEWLARPLSGTRTPRPGRIKVYETERTAMERLDIPHFATSAWKNMQHASDEQDLFLLCGDRDSRVLRRRLASLSARDCSRQVAIIKNSVRSRFAKKSSRARRDPSAD